ncbi:MAG: hypothetical protein EPO28_11840 [Saprospiraceae bacterium]|nr:MAG: hypothetical protein EPO28_11840 [Saprospiraceae bacterium]
MVIWSDYGAKAVKLKQALPAYPTDHPEALEVQKQLDDLLKETMTNSAAKTKTLQNPMIRYRAFIFPFLYDPNTPFENNGSGRAIRNLKVKLKVSGQFKTGQQHYCIIRSIIDTAIKNGQSVFSALAALALMPNPEKAAYSYRWRAWLLKNMLPKERSQNKMYVFLRLYHKSSLKNCDQILQHRGTKTQS